MMDLSFSSFCPLIYNLISSLVLLCIIVTGSFVFYLIYLFYYVLRTENVPFSTTFLLYLSSTKSTKRVHLIGSLKVNG
jgi:hypothetical protein